VKIGDMKIMEIMADTTNRIAEGEVLQLINKNNPNPNEQSYMQVIENKTAILFQAAAQCGAILTDADEETRDALKEFGMQMGIAFQLVDDVLDYDGDAEAMGKNVGDDLAEGKPTLPLIYAMEHSSEADAQLIRKCLADEELSKESLDEVIRMVNACGALDYTREKARACSGKARACLEKLPASPYRDALEVMVKFSIERTV
jgi:octaprenyl-diphosphate synthase